MDFNSLSFDKAKPTCGPIRGSHFTSSYFLLSLFHSCSILPPGPSPGPHWALWNESEPLQGGSVDSNARPFHLIACQKQLDAAGVVVAPTFRSYSGVRTAHAKCYWETPDLEVQQLKDAGKGDPSNSRVYSFYCDSLLSTGRPITAIPQDGVWEINQLDYWALFNSQIIINKSHY